MGIKIVKNHKITTFEELEVGEVFVGGFEGKPHDGTFSIKIQPQKNVLGGDCNTQEFFAMNHPNDSRLVYYRDSDQVFRVKFKNVELELV